MFTYVFKKLYLCCSMVTHLGLLCLLGGFTLIIVLCSSLSLVVFFALKSTLSDINVASSAFFPFFPPIPAFLLINVTWYVFCHPFTYFLFFFLIFIYLVS